MNSWKGNARLEFEDFHGKKFKTSFQQYIVRVALKRLLTLVDARDKTNPLSFYKGGVKRGYFLMEGQVRALAYPWYQRGIYRTIARRTLKLDHTPPRSVENEFGCVKVKSISLFLLADEKFVYRSAIVSATHLLSLSGS